MQDSTSANGNTNIGQYSVGAASGGKLHSYNYVQGRSLMNDIEMEFAKTVFSYNNERILLSQQQQEHLQQMQHKPNLLESFFKLSQKLNDKNIEEIWNMLNFMSFVAPLPVSSNETEVMRNSIQMQVQFANNAIKYLESTFKQYLKNYTMSNLEYARLGGVPSTLKLINGYLKLNPSKYYTSYEEIYIDNQPLWAIIYLCIRCGDYEAARDVAYKAKKEDLTKYLDELIKNLNDPSINYRRVSPNSENKLKLEYKSTVKRSQDAYKRAVYRYLSHYLIEDDLSEVLDSVDEFLWFYLSTITFQRESHNQSISIQQQQQHTEAQSYQEFQVKMSQEYGEKYFNKNLQNPYSYLQVLLLTAQFELAIEYLLKYEQMVVHAIHIAIALYEKNLLTLTRTPSNAQIISKEANDMKYVFRINFASLIKIYTRKFESTDPRDALEYYYLLRNILNTNEVQQLGVKEFGIDEHSKDENNYFAIYIAELALETREFELLFGKLEKNGQRKRGAIDKFLTNTDKIITIVAKEIEMKGLFEEAIKLYDLCKQQKRVLELCNKLISPIVSELSVQNSNRDRLKQMTLSIAERYKVDSSEALVPIPKSVSQTFNLLCDLMTFFDVYHAEKYDAAYDILNRLDILPQISENMETKVKKFTAFSEEVG